MKIAVLAQMLSLAITSLPAWAMTPIQAQGTSLAGFVGSFAAGPIGVPTHVTSEFQFRQLFVGPQPGAPDAYEQTDQFFQNTQTDAWVIRVAAPAVGPAPIAALLAALPKLPRVNLYVVPEIALQGAENAASADQRVIEFAHAHHAVAIFDLPPSVQTVTEAVGFMDGHPGLRSPWAAVYFPRIRIPNGTQSETVGVAGSAAGIYARLDGVQNVWKAPAGQNATILNSLGVAQGLTAQDSAILTQASINPVRVVQGQLALWGARNASRETGSARYISFTRFSEMIAESLGAGLAWTLFEPDTEATWAQVRQAVDSFFHGLFVQGALQGTSASQAYYVRCDATTTTAVEVSQGRFNLLYGFAYAAASEFSVGQLGLQAAQ